MMPIKKKLTQINDTDITVLVRAARVKGYKSSQDAAIWIISISPHWRSEGFKKLILEIDNVII